VKFFSQLLNDLFWYFFRGGLFEDIHEIGRFYRGGGADVIFFYKSGIDEQWLSSTALATQRASLKTAVVVNSRQALSNQKKGTNQYRMSQAAIFCLRCRVLISTATLAWFNIPFGTKWIVNMPHSLVSLHVIYDKKAFRGYNFFFCAGQHHMAEAVALDREAGRLIRLVAPIGYGKMDLLRSEYAKFQKSEKDQQNSLPLISVAPSWGQSNIVEGIGRNLVAGLLKKGYRVTLRPHPMQARSKIVRFIAQDHKDNPNFTIEDVAKTQESLFTATLMISDYSGVALEYAFLRERPVLFLDVPKKVGNPNWELLGLEPIELALRTEIGELLPPDNLPQILAAVDRLVANPFAQQEKIRLARSKYLYNFEDCSAAASTAIAGLLF
jgi:hypothetical protein